MSRDEFMTHCIAMGGDWTGMLLSGIREVFPEVFEAMPDRMYAFDEVGFIVQCLCDEPYPFRFNRSLEGEIIEYLGGQDFAYRKATDEEQDMSIRKFDEIYNNYVEAE